MKSSLRSRVVATALVPLGIVAAAGCADNESSLYILGVAVVEPPDCTVRADANTTVLFDGLLDVGIGSRYVAPLIVGNQMAPRGDKENLRSETAHVTLKGAEVRLEDAEGAVIREFTVPGAGFSRINQADQAGFGSIGITLIPASIASTFRSNLAPFGTTTTVVANVRVFGDTLGGRELESSEYAFPIEICNGCSIGFDREFLDEFNDECSAPSEADGPISCSPGQDSITPCIACAQNFEICQCPPQGRCQM